jgi:hypothetical protein
LIKKAHLSIFQNNTSALALPARAWTVWFMHWMNFRTLDKNYKHKIEIIVDRVVNDARKPPNA